MHFGTLVAALGSFLDARHHRGEWIVRMEDLDRPRTVAGAADSILRGLQIFGLEWDGEVEYQSHRDEAYEDAFHELKRADLVYPCACTRRDLRAHGRMGHEGPIYAGTCRNGLASGKTPRTWRVRTHSDCITVQDQIQGPLRQQVESEVGDFIVRRADGLYAYQLAVVIDDAWQGITHVVRGADLLPSTPRQIYLQRRLGLPTPTYAHLPVVSDPTGLKLSKQSFAPAVDMTKPATALLAALGHLHQPLPPQPFGLVRELISWSIDQWDITRIPAVPSLPIATVGKV